MEWGDFCNQLELSLPPSFEYVQRIEGEETPIIEETVQDEGWEMDGDGGMMDRSEVCRQNLAY